MTVSNVASSETASVPRWLREAEAGHAALARAVSELLAPLELPVDLRCAEQPLLACHRHLYRMYLQGFDPLQCVGLGLEALTQLLSELDPLQLHCPEVQAAVGHLSRCEQHLSEAQGALLSVHSAPIVPVDFLASLDVPRFHQLPRDVVVPVLEFPPVATVELLRVPPALPRPQSFEQLEQVLAELRGRSSSPQAPASEGEPAAQSDDVAPPAEPLPPAPGFVANPLPACSVQQFFEQRARECFEDVCMLCGQRTPQLGDPWRGMQFMEQRLLSNMDALVSLGERGLAALEPLILRAPAPDPLALEGLVFVAGCCEGRDLLAAAERVLDQNRRSAAFHASFARALKLVPHPSLADILRSWLRAPDRERRALAIEVLGYRGWASPGELSAACDDEPMVASTALPYWALGPREQVLHTLDRMLCRTEPELQPGLWQALLLAGHAEGHATLRAALDGQRRDQAAVLLGVACERRDAELLLERFRQAPRVALATALGWLGSGQAPPLLIAALALGDEELQWAAAAALERITGAQLLEEHELPAEQVMEVEVPESEAAAEPRLARDGVSAGSPDTLTLPAISQASWASWWELHHERFAKPLRYRRGKPYTPLVVLEELDLWPETPAERRLNQLELCLGTGRYVHFDPHDFVPVQVASIEAWQPLAAKASGSPGAWTRPSRK